jgi:hypothetical protein
MIEFQRLKKTYNDIAVYDIQKASQITWAKLEDYPGIISEISSSQFCPQKMMQYMLKCNKIMKIQYGNGEITLHLFYVNELEESLYKIFRTIKQCLIVKQYFGIQNPMNIYIIFNPDKRYIPANGHIDCSHINGGFTKRGENGIFIIRQEEYSKVIIHELLHHSDMIHKEYWPHQELMRLKKQFNIASNTVLIPNEAIIEFWATILYIHFLSFEYNISYNLLMQREMQHSLEQYHKIMHKQKNKPWYETTNAFCYIVFKCILLYNASEFIKSCKWPYDSGYVTEFLVTHDKFSDFASKGLKWDKGLRMMKLSDY